MIEIRNQPAPLPGVTTNESSEPAAPAVALAQPEAGSGSGTDPLAKFGAMHGFHPGVALYTKQAGSAQQNAKAAPPMPPEVYDISKVKQDVIDGMKNSPDAATRKLGVTIENAQASYGDFLKKEKGAKILVLTSAGNGGQPVMVVTGPKFNAAEKARVITFYHGDNATVADPIGSKAGINTRIRDAVTKEPQTVFVLPEAIRTDGKPWGVDSAENRNQNDYSASWSEVRSQAQTTDEALRARGIGKDMVGRETVAVHSKGGSVIESLMNKDDKGRLLRADRLELYDSLYGSQGSVAQWGKTKNGKAAGAVIYYRGTNEPGRDQVIANAFGNRFVKIEMGGRLLGVPENKIYHDADGNTYPRDYPWTDNAGKKHVRHDYVRDFHESPHYKTTGIFLGRDPGLNAI
jgi:hypothetical protein